MKDVTKEFGFQSENALKFAFSCSDHHKTWWLLETVMISFTDELLYAYAKEALQDKKEVKYW